MRINGHKQKAKKREWLRYRDFVLSPYGVIKIKSLGYMTPGESGVFYNRHFSRSPPGSRRMPGRTRYI
ncbi:hypothetical protein [Symbiopectobacterium sp. RP]|uniref:hypothetical protein n=1 Tax=Symbiopectobacterium sp. RP TaxID=3248553 RepID=UPI003D2A4C96